MNSQELDRFQRTEIMMSNLRKTDYNYQPVIDEAYISKELMRRSFKNSILVEGLIGSGKTTNINKILDKSRELIVKTTCGHLNFERDVYYIQLKAHYKDPMRRTRNGIPIPEKSVIRLEERIDSNSLKSYYNSLKKYSKEKPSRGLNLKILKSHIKLQTRFLQAAILKGKIAASMMINKIEIYHHKDRNMMIGHRDINLVIQDRSLLGNLAFILLIVRNHILTRKEGPLIQDELDLIQPLYEDIKSSIKAYLCRPGDFQSILFVHDSVEQAMGRMNSRGRDFEHGLTRDYQEDLLSIYLFVILEFLKHRSLTNIRVVDTYTLSSEIDKLGWKHDDFLDSFYHPNPKVFNHCLSTNLIFNEDSLDDEFLEKTQLCHPDYPFGISREERDKIIEMLKDKTKR